MVLFQSLCSQSMVCYLKISIGQFKSESFTVQNCNWNTAGFPCCQCFSPFVKCASTYELKNLLSCLLFKIFSNPEGVLWVCTNSALEGDCKVCLWDEGNGCFTESLSHLRKRMVLNWLSEESASDALSFECFENPRWTCWLMAVYIYYGGWS